MLRLVREWLWDVHGLTCLEATRLAARGMDGPLTFRERVKLSMHSLLCGYCRNYRRQLRLLRKWMRRFSVHDALSPGPKIPAVSASKMKKRLEREISRSQ